MLKKIALFLLLLFLAVGEIKSSTAYNIGGLAERDTVTVKQKRGFFGTIGKFVTNIFDAFSNVDTTYIEPQHYNYTVMMQNTNNYERYTLSSKSGQTMTFAPKPSIKVGPYFGWQWLFLGYTFDVNHLKNGSNKTELDFSFYTALFGIDLYYKKAGEDFKLRSMKNADDNLKINFKDLPFDGVKVDTKGFDVYYIFNHRKFSYPAAYSQSTCQKKSCGSALLGVGYTSNSISLDYNKLEKTVNDYVKTQPQIEQQEFKIDSGLKFDKVKYMSVSVSGGYAYNWVFARNFLFNASLSLALAYKHSSGDNQIDKGKYNFDFKNFNLDGVGRFGVVWNNTRWFVGANYIIHSYYYHKSRFSTNNYVGKMNVYVGLNFGKKKKYRN